MNMLEVTITVTLQVPDTGDKVGDCLAAMDAAKKLFNEKPGHKLLRVKKAWNGDPLVSITRLRRSFLGGVIGTGGSLEPLCIDVPVEG